MCIRRSSRTRVCWKCWRTGGELWLYDPNGEETMEVKGPLRGFPDVTVGQKIRGRRVSIKDSCRRS